MRSYGINNLDLIRMYEEKYPSDIIDSRRAWRVAFMFDQMGLFDSALMLALSNNQIADWSLIYKISVDVDMAHVSEFKLRWPDPSHLRSLGEL